MAETIIMPKLGFNMSEGRLVKWHIKEGETIRKGEPLFSIETDKTTMDIEATGDGVLRKILLEEGGKVPVTLPIAIVAGADEDIEAVLSEAVKKLGIEAPSGEDPGTGAAFAQPGTKDTQAAGKPATAEPSCCKGL